MKIKMYMWWILGLGIVVLAAWLYFRLNVEFGGRLNKDHLQEYAKAYNWDGEKFTNSMLTTMNISPGKIPGLIKNMFSGRASRAPKKNIPIVPFDENRWNVNEGVKYIWYGHSALLVKIDGVNLLIDPMLGPDSSPVGPVTTKRFSKGSLDVIDQLPNIDAILITHDHYDHLDYQSIARLKDKVKSFYVGIGIGRHLERWGIPSNHITEFVWWDEHNFNNLKITYTPSRHFSGRGLTDRNTSLWGGWAIKSDKNNVYISGDGGYGDHFKAIGERLGPFDLGFLECGQYNEDWHQIHMYPEETVMAGLDSQCKQVVPIHWGAFTLAFHNWTDPAIRFTSEAEKKNLKNATPEIGEIVILDEAREWSNWWEKYD